MSEEEFATLDTQSKWYHIEQTMLYIMSMDKAVEHKMGTNAYGMDQKKRDQIRSMRLDQYQRWSHVKNLYAVHRDELVNTLENTRFEECKSILERIFTNELDDALRDVIDE